VSELHDTPNPAVPLTPGALPHESQAQTAAVAQQRQQSHLFISYSTVDQVAVERLRESLERGLYWVWKDTKQRKDGIPPGAHLDTTISSAITCAGAVLFCLSPDFFKSTWCKAEVEQALREGKRIFPLIIRPLNDAPEWEAWGLKAWRALDFTQQASYEARLAELRPYLPLPFSRRVWQFTRRSALFTVVGLLIMVVLIVSAALGSGLMNTLNQTATPLPPTPTQYIQESLGVAVAYFAPASPDLETAEADQLVDGFSTQLQRQISQLGGTLGLPVGYLGPEVIGRINGDGLGTSYDDAKEISLERNATIVIYGRIEFENGRLQLNPRFYVPPSHISPAQELTGSYRLGQPVNAQNFTDAQTELAERARLLALLVDGVTKYLTDDFEGSLASFTEVRRDSSYDTMIGRDVLHMMIGNANLRLAAKAADACDRRTVLGYIDQAVGEFEDALTTFEQLNQSETIYVRPHSGLAAAYFLRARWQPEENDGCADELYIFDWLYRGLEEIDQAQAALARRDDPSQDEPVVRASFLLNEGRLTYILCVMTLSGTITEPEEDYCARFETSASRLIGAFGDLERDEGWYVAPFAAQAWGFRGDIAQMRAVEAEETGEGDPLVLLREAVSDYDSALAIDNILPLHAMLFTAYKGDAYYAMGQLENARNAYDAARQLAEQNQTLNGWAEEYTFMRDSVDQEIALRTSG
jgi:tetratricopeptide (TPR) repeat protein